MPERALLLPGLLENSRWSTAGPSNWLDSSPDRSRDRQLPAGSWRDSERAGQWRRAGHELLGLLAGLLVGEGLGGLLAVLGDDEGNTLAGAGPVAELELGRVPADEGDGVVAEDLDALLARASHLEVHAGSGRGPDLLQVEVACFGWQAQVEGAAGLIRDARHLEGVVGAVIGHANGERGGFLARAGVAELGGVGLDDQAVLVSGPDGDPIDRHVVTGAGEGQGLGVGAAQ